MRSEGTATVFPTKEAAPLATGTQKNLSKISPTSFETNPGVFLKGLSGGLSIIKELDSGGPFQLYAVRIW